MVTRRYRYGSLTAAIDDKSSPLRKYLDQTFPNHTALQARSGSQDSVLGLHEDCRYIIAEGGLPRQVLIAGKSTSNARVAAAASIAFAFPGLTTILTEEPVGSATAWRLHRDSRISVAIGNSPADLKISTAQPQVPQSGTLRWNSAISPLAGLPSQYRISGSLQQQETIVQSQLFVAGALVGIAGAAFLWCVELLLDLPRRRRTAGFGTSRRAAP